jgi:glycosyltransferase involved in cell wall biosynthesis
MRAYDIVVVPSRNEPFGIVVLEAWAARCLYRRSFVLARTGPRLIERRRPHASKALAGEEFAFSDQVTPDPIEAAA